MQRQACLYLYSGEAAFQASQPTLALRQHLGVQTQVLDAREVAALEPALAPLFARAAAALAAARRQAAAVLWCAGRHVHAGWCGLLRCLCLAMVILEM